MARLRRDRRSAEELPARREEVHHAEQEGIRFELLAAPVEVIGEQGWVCVAATVILAMGDGKRAAAAIDAYLAGALPSEVAVG